MNYHKKQILFMFVILAYVFTAIHMNSCYVSCNFQKGKEKGLYPDTSDFPNSKWNCKESEICFSILDYGESTIIGTYKEKDTTYRLVANFSFYAPELDFTLYSSTSEWESHYQDQAGIFYTHCERQILGTVYTNYVYR